jgi:hypothetical protein
VRGHHGRQQDQQRRQHRRQVLGAEDGGARQRLEQDVGDGAVAQLGPERRGREDQAHDRQQHGQDELAVQVEGEGGRVGVGAGGEQRHHHQRQRDQRHDQQPAPGQELPEAEAEQDAGGFHRRPTR